MTEIFINVLFGTGLRAPAAPGSIFAVYAQTASGDYLGVTLSVVGGIAASFLVATFLLKPDKGDWTRATWTSRPRDGGDEGQGLTRIVGGQRVQGHAHRADPSIVFACDAGMGSSAMGASVLRNKIKDAGFTEVTVVNKAIANLDDSYDLVVTHQDLTERARHRTAQPSTSRSTTSWPAPGTTTSSECSARRTVLSRYLRAWGLRPQPPLHRHPLGAAPNPRSPQRRGCARCFPTRPSS